MPQAATDLTPPPTVILAVDNDDLRRTLAQRIRSLGYGLAEAADGPQLITALTATCFGPGSSAGGVVISDLAPNGLLFDALRMLRSCARCPSLIVALPVHALVHRAEAKQLGAVAILDRPLDVEVLMKTLAARLPVPRTTVRSRGQSAALAI